MALSRAHKLALCTLSRAREGAAQVESLVENTESSKSNRKYLSQVVSSWGG